MANFNQKVADDKICGRSQPSGFKRWKIYFWSLGPLFSSINRWCVPFDMILDKSQYSVFFKKNLAISKVYVLFEFRPL